MKNYSKKFSIEIQKPRKIIDAYKCEKCDKAFATKQNLKLHIEKCFQERKYKCPCGKKFRTRQNLVEHLQTDFESHMTPECDKCGKEFSDLRNLEKHIPMCENPIFLE